MENPRGEETGKALANELDEKKAQESRESFLAMNEGREPIKADVPIVAAKDPGRGHFYVSMVKSAVRFLGYGMMLGVGGYVAYAGIALIIAEALGIAEELV